MSNIGNFIELNKSGKIWAIGSIHSNLESFIAIKNFILKNFNFDDKLIFLGNIIGLGDNKERVIVLRKKVDPQKVMVVRL